MSSLSVPLSKALEGYMLAASARRLSRNTLSSYAQTFRAFEAFVDDDREIDAITATDVQRFLADLEHLAPKSVRNYHTALSALWTWAVDEDLARQHVVREVTPPKPAPREIVPYTRADLQAMLAACDQTEDYTRPGKARCTNTRPTALRDRAMIMLLVDTGIRASELCGLRLYECDLKNRRVTVQGKGAKERVVPMSARTSAAIWRYLATRDDLERRTVWLFATADGGPLNRNGLRKLLNRIGRRAHVPGVTVHRFRHTFAITFLRNGGHVFALQRMLGHSTMEMVRRYLAIAETDIEEAHLDASPVMNWML